MPTDNATRLPGRIFRLLSCCLGAAVLWACGPVYIPVPPPDSETTFTQDLLVDTAGAEQTFWITTGGPSATTADAVFYIFDEQQNAGVIAGAKADGSYQAPPMQGTAGDRILINYQNSHGNLSLSACVLLSELRPTAARCP